MALGDSMASRFSQSTVLLLPNHNHIAVDDSAASSSSAATTSSYGGNAAAATSLAYLPQTVVLCELRHEAFEAAVPAGPSDSGLVSKWRPKDRVSFAFFHTTFFGVQCKVVETGFLFLFLGCWLRCVMVD